LLALSARCIVMTLINQELENQNTGLNGRLHELGQNCMLGIDR
jgi:hypothetical protein